MRASTRWRVRLRRFRRDHASTLRWVAGVAVLGVLLLAFMSWRWFVRPTVDQPDRADAIVLFAGGRGERLRLALDLVDRDVAEHLVLPNGNLPHWGAARALCDGLDPQLTVHCFAPDPDDTWGEAAGIAAIAEQEGWTHVVAVTSEFHVHRVRLLLGRCFDGTVEVVGAEPGVGFGDHVQRVAHEWAGTLAAQTIRRSCG